MRVVTRVIFIAYFFEVGVLLTLAPWSVFWDRNYFIAGWPLVAAVAGNDYVRGAISGVGLINLAAGAAELIGLFTRKPKVNRPAV